ncbi:hypothetical protein CC80DRAFT_444146 [Byssothecium circinans]|uniref:Uncharacterized protein n=1 Tax=Byssothecium circinans TaxID=147558 RepID=A0A6A5U1L0_9PLEO|nr:hypothetical protein CC80DRAFT_444146 [Byssothecium circinans]
MAGQGLYGQGQEDQILSPEEEASINVDALVSDSVADDQGPGALRVRPTIDPPRHATPTIPPGFIAAAVPRSVASEQPTRPSSRNTPSTIATAVPVVPTTSTGIAPPIQSKKSNQSTENADAATSKTTDSNTTTPTETVTPSKANRQTSSSKLPVVQETPKKMAENVSSETPKENKKASTANAKTTPKKPVFSKKTQSVVDSSPRKSTKDVPAPAANPTSTKRQHPGKLDIAAATKVPENEQSLAKNSTKIESQPKVGHAISTTTNSSVPGSPAHTSTGSPVKKPTTAPRTLRVVATPRVENPAPLSAVSTTSHPQIPTVEKLRSRQASIASVNLPGTPGSELVSDTASITSTSISRASSPPPIGGKVGTAPVRQKTKSQQKKERQERARREEEHALAMEKLDSEADVVQEPLMGRKKKAKKPSNNPKSLAVLTKSQPQSPKPAEIEEVKEQVEPPSVPLAANKKHSTTKTPTPSPHTEPAPPTETTRQKREATAQSIIADLQKTGDLLASALEFFKPLPSALAHASRPTQINGGPVAPPDLRLHLSPADVEALSKKQPVRLKSVDGRPESSTLITPQGKFFWGLTPELEEKALALEEQIEQLKGAGRFRPRKDASHRQQTSPHAPLPALQTALNDLGKSAGQPMPKLDSSSTRLGSTSLPLSPTTDLPLPQTQPQQQTPTDAGTYLNQFVLPNIDRQVPPSSRQEMAAVGGLPGSGTMNMSVSVNRIAKAARAVAEGGAVGSELEGMGVMAADLLGGVFVQSLEALIGASLNIPSSGHNVTLDKNRHLSMSRNDGIDIQGFVNTFEAGSRLGNHAFSGAVGGGDNDGRRRPLLGVEETEQAMLSAKKEHEALEKKLVGVMKKNKKLGGMGKA